MRICGGGIDKQRGFRLLGKTIYYVKVGMATVDAYRRDKVTAQRWLFANNALTNVTMQGANPYPHK